MRPSLFFLVSQLCIPFCLFLCVALPLLLRTSLLGLGFRCPPPKEVDFKNKGENYLRHEARSEPGRGLTWRRRRGGRRHTKEKSRNNILGRGEEERKGRGRGSGGGRVEEDEGDEGEWKRRETGELGERTRESQGCDRTRREGGRAGGGSNRRRRTGGGREGREVRRGAGGLKWRRRKYTIIMKATPTLHRCPMRACLLFASAWQLFLGRGSSFVLPNPRPLVTATRCVLVSLRRGLGID